MSKNNCDIMLTYLKKIETYSDTIKNKNYTDKNKIMKQIHIYHGLAIFEREKLIKDIFASNVSNQPQLNEDQLIIFSKCDIYLRIILDIVRKCQESLKPDDYNKETNFGTLTTENDTQSGIYGKIENSNNESGIYDQTENSNNESEIYYQKENSNNESEYKNNMLVTDIKNNMRGGGDGDDELDLSDYDKDNLSAYVKGITTSEAKRFEKNKFNIKNTSKSKSDSESDSDSNSDSESDEEYDNDQDGGAKTYDTIFGSDDDNEEDDDEDKQYGGQSLTDFINNLNTTDAHKIENKSAVTEFNYKNKFYNDKFALVYVWANWCGPSNRFNETWKKFIDVGHKTFSDLTILDLDTASKNKSDVDLLKIAQQMGIKSYPSLALYVNRNVYIKSASGLNIDDIVSFIKDKVSTKK